MARNSLFAILLRSPWWASAGVFAAVALVAYAAVPREYAPYVLFGGAPFAVISLIVVWRRLQAPSPARVARARAAVQTMSWREFSAALETAYRHDGQAVEPLRDGGADFEVAQGWRTTVVSGKRWKAARLGVEPLRQLQATREAREAHGGTYITLGEPSDAARAYAAEHGIRVMQADELAQWLCASGAVSTKAPAPGQPRSR